MEKKLLVRKISQGTEVSPRHVQRLEGVLKSGNNFTLVASTDEHPLYLVAHGRILHREPVSEIQTAVSAKLGRRKEEDEIELSSNMGQVPDNTLGSAMLETLNHVSDGKFVAFPEETGKADVVFTSRKPADWLLSDDKRIHSELENHAKTKVLVDPILRRTTNYGQPDPRLTYPEIRTVAQDIVDTSLDLEYRLRDKFTPTQYLPIPQRSVEE